MKSIILLTALLIGLFSVCASQASPTSPSGDGVEVDIELNRLRFYQ